MGNHIKRSVLFVAAVFLAAAARPNEIAVPAFTIAQAYDLRVAKFTDKLASALSMESGYTVFHHAEIAARIDPDILTNINIEDIVTLEKVAVASGVGYVVAGEADVSGDQVTVMVKLFRASDKSVLLSFSEYVTGTLRQLDRLIPGIVAKICAALPPYVLPAVPESTVIKTKGNN